MKSKFQKSEKQVIKRSLIKLANYNPRKISEKARIELKKNIKRVGLLGGIIWNKTTGNLIAGHQRISILDSLENYPANDYDLEIDVAEMDDKTEKEQNIFMNSTSVQGEFDLIKLNELITVSNLNLDFVGFNESDFQIIGIENLKNKHSEKQEIESFLNNNEYKEEETIINDNDRIESIKQLKQDIKEKLDNNQTTEPYILISFQTIEEKYSFMKKYELKKDLNIIDSRTFQMTIKKFNNG